MRIELQPFMREAQVLATAMGAAAGAVGVVPAAIRGIATDSREIRSGDLFVAIAGEHRDGRLFMQDALHRGAAGLLVPRGSIPPKGNYWLLEVSDCGAALLSAAAVRCKKSGAKRIAVSGSTGKTTVKESVAALLSVKNTVQKSEGNYNSGIGMPLSLLGMEEADYFVAELGINHKGEMRPLSETVRPHIALLTNIGAAHLGNFSSLNALAAEKAKLAAGQSEHGLLLTGEEIPRSLFARYAPRILHVGTGCEADFRAVNLRMDGSGVRADVKGMGRIVKGLYWPLPGRIGLSTLLFSVAVGILEEKSADTIRAGVQRAWEFQPRMRILREAGRMLIDDTYNASPEAVISSVETACLLADRRPVVAVLGDMLELGHFSEEYHRFVGQCIAGKGIKYLFALGKYAPCIARGARLGGMPTDAIFCFSEGEERELTTWVAEYAPKGAVLLFKASRKMAFDVVLEGVRRKL